MVWLLVRDTFTVSKFQDSTRFEFTMQLTTVWLPEINPEMFKEERVGTIQNGISWLKTVATPAILPQIRHWSQSEWSSRVWTPWSTSVLYWGTKKEITSDARVTAIYKPTVRKIQTEQKYPYVLGVCGAWPFRHRASECH